MIEVGEAIVSCDLFFEFFCCELSECKGCCCVEGDSGAPVETDEVEKLEEVLPAVWDDLSDKAKEVINSQGVCYVDTEGDLVTSLVNGRECVFTCMDEGVCKCAIEKAYKDGKTDFYKPISCHLYPIRLTRYEGFTAVNYHKWSVCECARRFGAQLGMPVYVFLKDALIRRFGAEWYEQLEIADQLYKESKKRNNKS